jgi:xanthine dehydrogenase YagR molybdenum-binding subunit
MDDVAHHPAILRQYPVISRSLWLAASTQIRNMASATLDPPEIETKAVSDVDKKHKDPSFGDAQQAFGIAPVKIDQEYETSAQHHNPMELFTTTCAWSNGKLMVLEPSQFV